MYAEFCIEIQEDIMPIICVFHLDDNSSNEVFQCKLSLFVTDKMNKNGPLKTQIINTN